MFYNNKDFFFLTTYLLASYFSFRLIIKPTLMLGCLAGLLVGLSASIRLVGFTIILALFLSFLFVREDLKKQKQFRFTLLTYCVASVASLILFLPFLWTNTVTKLLSLSTNALSFNWVGKNFFDGRKAWSNDLPWDYLPLWIGVTTPPLILFLSVAGCTQTIFVLAKKCFSTDSSSKFSQTNLQDFFMMQLLLIPLISAILLNVTIYNGWRHFYFIYPFLVYFAVIAIFSWRNKFKIIRRLSIFAVILSVVFSISWLIRYNPLSGLYFNFLAGTNVSQKWEVDYWAISNREILERISTLDKGVVVLYDWNNSPLYDSKVFLSEESKKRISILKHSDTPSSSDYIIDRSNSCKKSGDYCVFEGGIVTREVIKRIVGSAHVYSVYRLEKSPT